MRIPIPTPIALSILAGWLTAGCGSGTQPAAGDSAPTRTSSSAAAVTNGKIKFKDGSGNVLFSLKPKDDGAKLVDAGEKELARFNVSGDKTKVKTAEDDVVGYVVGTNGRFKVTTADQSTILYKLLRQDDGDWKLEDGADGLIYKIKKRDYGFEIEDPAEKSLAKAKRKDDKSSLRDADDQTLYSTNDPILPEALACLGFEHIGDVRLRVALLFCLNRGSGPP